jgi:hypothetical protein
LNMGKFGGDLFLLHPSPKYHVASHIAYSSRSHICHRETHRLSLPCLLAGPLPRPLRCDRPPSKHARPGGSTTRCHRYQ